MNKNFLNLITLLLFSSIALCQSSTSSKIDQHLILNMDKSDVQDCILVLKDASTIMDTRHLKSKEEKAHYVYHKLKNRRQKSQKRITDFLDKENINYRSFFIVNAISCELSPDQMQELTKFDELLKITNDPDIRLEEAKSNSALSKNATEAEWGIQKINADSVWTLGYQGQDVVIAGQDTGYDWEHPVLRQKYRGLIDTLIDHNYNWHDAIHEINPMHGDTILDPGTNPCGVNLRYPCDDHNHGTHTMGTMIGSDSTNLLGVAPAAKWMACRNMERGIGTPSTYLECFEWFLAPTDLDNMNPRPELAPDVINNSWSCPESEGCNESNWDLLREAVINLKASGVVVVVSAGNNGFAGCGSIASPPAIFRESFTVGATRANDTIAGFSSRGPVIVDSSFILKPDVSAPGHNVRSSIRNGGFANFSGTSMAGPHVAGAVALIISANPSLRGQVELIEDILKESAVIRTDSTECFGFNGTDPQNHIYGHGRIDVLKAVEMALAISNTESLGPDQYSITIFPNPSSGIINIDYGDGNHDLGGLQIFDTMGSLVKTYGSAPQRLDLSSLDTGLYYLQWRINDRNIVKKIILNR